MKFKSYSVFFVLLFCFALFSYTGPQEEMDLAKVRKAIEETNLKFVEAVRQGDAASIPAFYTKDASVLPENSEMIQGRQAIEGYWNAVLQIGVKDVVLTIVDVLGSDDLAYKKVRSEA